MKRPTGRALRAPLAGSPAFVSVFDFVFDLIYVSFPFGIYENPAFALAPALMGANIEKGS